MFTDRAVIREVKSRKKNFAMTWIDSKKAYNMVPHLWINECLDLSGVTENSKTLLTYLLTPRFNMHCSPCLRVALHHCHAHFDSWNGSPYTMPFYFEPTMHPKHGK